MLLFMGYHELWGDVVDFKERCNQEFRSTEPHEYLLFKLEHLGLFTYSQEGAPKREVRWFIT